MSAFLCSDSTFVGLAAYSVRWYGNAPRVAYFTSRMGLAADNSASAAGECAEAASLFLPKQFKTWEDFERNAGPAHFIDVLAAILKAENMRSLEARYAGEPAYTRADAPKATPDLVRAAAVFLPGVVFKLAHCLDYQSCETSDWRQTVAYQVLETIKDTAARKTEGYEQAPWGL